MNKNIKLAQRLRCDVFASRDTVDEAFAYAYEVLKNNPAGLTALYVVLNTVCNEIVENEKEVA
ncbi:MAG: hypothetical protein ACOVLB_03350 [Candidatus Nanopelagicus sp.]